MTLLETYLFGSRIFWLVVNNELSWMDIHLIGQLFIAVRCKGPFLDHCYLVYSYINDIPLVVNARMTIYNYKTMSTLKNLLKIWAMYSNYAVKSLQVSNLSSVRRVWKHSLCGVHTLYLISMLPYSGKVWRIWQITRRSPNLNHPNFFTRQSKQRCCRHSPNFFSPTTFLLKQFAKLYPRQTFLLYGIERVATKTCY